MSEKVPLTIDDLLARIVKLEVYASERVYVLHFKSRNLGPLKKVFRLNGTLKDAITLGQTHCIKMGYGFIIVKPYEVNLNHQEQLKKEDPNYLDETFQTHQR